MTVRECECVRVYLLVGVFPSQDLARHLTESGSRPGPWIFPSSQKNLTVALFQPRTSGRAPAAAHDRNYVVGRLLADVTRLLLIFLSQVTPGGLFSFASSILLAGSCPSPCNRNPREPENHALALHPRANNLIVACVASDWLLRAMHPPRGDMWTEWCIQTE